MWSYYGSKSKIINYYPSPKYSKIIEPFAGSARYALKYFDRDILLVDKYDVIIKIWKYLQQCSPKDIIGLPTLSKGKSISDFNLSEDESLFLGMLAGVSSTQPRNKISYFASSKNGNKNIFKVIASHLFKIKHWEIKLGSFTEIENQNANAYVMSNKLINFKELSDWCINRQGQTIVCENTKADWMNFNPIIKQKGSLNTTTEAIWTNEHTVYNNTQTALLL